MDKEKLKKLGKSAKRRNRNRYRKWKGRSSTATITNQCSRAQQTEGSGYLDGARLWRQSYETIVMWQLTHNVSYYRQRADDLARQNDELRRQIKYGTVRQEEYETSSSDEDEVIAGDQEECDKKSIDEGYLNFMAITEKHRAELKRKKTTEHQDD